MPISSSRNRLLTHLDKDSRGSISSLNTKSSGHLKKPLNAGHHKPATGSYHKPGSGSHHRNLHEKLPNIHTLRITAPKEKSSQQEFGSIPSLSRGSTKSPKRSHHKKLKETKDLHKDIVFTKIRFFNHPPEPEPFTLCFGYPGTDLTHREILNGIKRSKYVTVDNIRNIQFIDMNVVLGSADVDNRWLIRVKDYDTRYELLREGIKIDDDRINLRRYDDVSDEEYKAFQKRQSILQSDEHNEIQRLLANSLS